MVESRIRRQLASIQTHVHELRTLIRPEDIENDIVVQRFAERTFQMAVDAAIDVAARVLDRYGLGKGDTSAELFSQLGRKGWLPVEVVVPLVDLVAVRNKLVHGEAEYSASIVQKVHAQVLRRVVGDDLGHLLRMVEQIHRRIESAPPDPLTTGPETPEI